jgi:hypothetical protein
MNKGDYTMDIQTTLAIIEKLQAIQEFANGHYITTDQLNVMIGKLRIELITEVMVQETLMERQCA